MPLPGQKVNRIVREKRYSEFTFLLLQINLDPPPPKKKKKKNLFFLFRGIPFWCPRLKAPSSSFGGDGPMFSAGTSQAFEVQNPCFGHPESRPDCFFVFLNSPIFLGGVIHTQKIHRPDGQPQKVIGRPQRFQSSWVPCPSFECLECLERALPNAHASFK